jgi:hypothetical protein
MFFWGMKRDWLFLAVKKENYQLFLNSNEGKMEEQDEITLKNNLNLVLFA